METICCRFKPGQDLVHELNKVVQENQLQAACVLTCVGSLTSAHVRFANQPKGTTLKGHFEIVSMTGMLAVHGNHIHMSIADTEGQCRGGHVMERGNVVYTTVELVIGVMAQNVFKRTFDPDTGFPELEIVQC